jgi:hypothetical protein
MRTRTASHPAVLCALPHRIVFCCALLLAVHAAGCSSASPVGMAVKVGTYAVGKVVSDSNTKGLAGELMGQPPSAADAKLGRPVDVLRDVNSPRQWRTYRVKMDALDLQRYVVEVAGNQVVGIEKVQRPTGGADIARALAYEGMVKGKSAAECQRKLGMGPPVLVVYSNGTGGWLQLYNASVIKGLGQKYCVVRLDKNGLCQKVELVDVAASQGATPS